MAQVFAALGHPTRLAIMERLLEGEASVAELAEPFAMTTRAVSKHVAVLESAGLVSRTRDAQRRPSRIRIGPLVRVDRWLEDYRHLWLERFDQLDERLRRLQRQRGLDEGERAATTQEVDDDN
jgi:DNA-binding transcriptional ArsR family regulator